ncbi:hypothetical protein ACWGJT_03235 [Streptomyces xantholiticus]
MTASHPPDTGVGTPARPPQQGSTLIPASVELPLAQHILPSGLASTVYQRFNRIRKALATAYYLHISHHGVLTDADIDSLTQHQMVTAARSAGVSPPNSDDSRDLIRRLLRVFNGIDAPASDVVDTPVTRDELAHALNGLAVVVQAAAQGVRQ